jgi:hypothetical protein
LLLAFIVGLSAAFFFSIQRRTATPGSSPPAPASSADAFARTYLDIAAGKPLLQKTPCKSCHEQKDDHAPEAWESLTRRWKLRAGEWAAEIQLGSRCGTCHITPDPRALPWKNWNEVVHRMDEITQQRGLPRLTPVQRRDLVHYYYAFSPDPTPLLRPDPDPKLSPVQFTPSVLGRGLDTNVVERPFIGHVQVTDLDQDGQPDVLVCDSDNSSLNWIHQKKRAAGQPGVWQEKVLAKVPAPARAGVFTNRATGRLEIVVACQERMAPTDDLIGSVVLLRNPSETEFGRFSPATILTNIGRVASVEPGDFNNDGESDFVVAAFGHINVGEIGWVEQRHGAFSYHTILKRSGAIRVPPVDLNGDGSLDFIALFGQEHEQLSAFLNDGKPGFHEVPLFKAATPSFGSSSLQLIDLDQDGDIDLLYTNGDNMDLNTRIPRPYHGVQWLENRGNLQFIYHDIFRFYGAYCALPADINKDGHTDIVVTSLFNDWQDLDRASLVWLENNGHQQFTPHGIARQPIQLISAAIADFNHDGWPDIIASGMHIFPPFDRRGRITLWTSAAHPP